MSHETEESAVEWRSPVLSITLRRWIIRVAGWRLFWLVVSFVGLLTAIAVEGFVRPDGWGNVVTTAGTVVLPLVISLLIAPKQKSEDHSELSIQAVDDLEELRRSQESILEDLNSLDPSSLASDDFMRIMFSKRELMREHDQIANQIGYWAQVSPDVVRHVLERRSKLREMLAEMEEDRERYRNEDEV